MLIIYLTQYTQNIIISTYDQYKKLFMRYFTFFHAKSSKSDVSFTLPARLAVDCPHFQGSAATGS